MNRKKSCFPDINDATNRPNNQSVALLLKIILTKKILILYLTNISKVCIPDINHTTKRPNSHRAALLQKNDSYKADINSFSNEENESLSTRDHASRFYCAGLPIK